MDLADWINPVHLKKPSPSAFRHAKPFPHIVLKDFLKPRIVRLVATAVQRQPFTHKESDLFSLSQTPDLTRSTNPTLCAFHRFLTSRELRNHLTTLTGAKLGKSVDMSGFIYTDSDHLLTHDDKLEGRALAYILNLSNGLGRRDGGELELLSSKNGKPSRAAKRIPPTYNTLTIFQVTPTSFHQVREVLTDKQRLTLGGWFHAP